MLRIRFKANWTRILLAAASLSILCAQAFIYSPDTAPHHPTSIAFAHAASTTPETDAQILALSRSSACPNESLRITLDGGGPPTSTRLILDILFNLVLSEPCTSVSWEGYGTNAGKLGLSQQRASFAISATPLAASDYLTAPDLQQISVGAISVAPVMQLRPTASDPIILSQLSAVPLVFDRLTMARIWCGLITHWNDSAIQATNPQWAQHLPEREIEIVLVNIASGLNYIWLEAMGLFRSATHAQQQVTPDFVSHAYTCCVLRAARQRGTHFNIGID